MRVDVPTDSPQPGPDANRLDLGEGAWVHADDVRFTFARSSGPGGQSVNKVNTQALLRVAVESIRGLDAGARNRLRTMAGRRLTDADEILIRANTSRSQVSNRWACIARLAELVQRAKVRPKTRKPTRPSRRQVQRRLDSKKQRSEKKQRRGRVDDW